MTKGAVGKIPFGDMLDKVKAYGINAVEITTGGWGGCHYVPSARYLLDNPAKLQTFKDEFDRRNIAISALNCSGNPLVNNAMGKAHSQTIHDTAELAGKLGVKTFHNLLTRIRRRQLICQRQRR